ncbi:MAG: NAD(P)H-quinone oxidoreductase [Betaproteobacteria bacterium]
MKQIETGLDGLAASMTLAEAPMLAPGRGDILIETHFAGVNRPDVLQRAGLYPPPPGASSVLGLEVAGRVAALGESVTEWKVGDWVTALTPGGGYAEYCVAPAAHALPVPAGLSLSEAAALPETWFTVWANLVDLAHLKAGERLLVHGGSGGIGMTAIQLARHLGAEVIATAGSAAKVRFCLEQGATQAINYRETDFVAQTKAITGGEGVDVVLDMVGAPYFQRNLSVLRRDGRLVEIAFLQGSKSEIDLMPIMLKRLVVTGSTMRPRTVVEKQAIRDALLASVWPALADGRCRPHIGAVFPLAEAGAAHALMESGGHLGKIVLEVRD